jgi:hypothetical protein
LEDEEPSVSYRVDWVKGKGAGRKPNKGRPPKPNTSNMTAERAEHAIRHGRKVGRGKETFSAGEMLVENK